MGRLFTANNRKRPQVCADQLPIGDVFRGNIGTYTDFALYLRAYDIVVGLEHPNRTWNWGDASKYPSSPPSITNYLSVDALLTEDNPNEQSIK